MELRKGFLGKIADCISAEATTQYFLNRVDQSAVTKTASEFQEIQVLRSLAAATSTSVKNYLHVGTRQISCAILSQMFKKTFKLNYFNTCYSKSLSYYNKIVSRSKYSIVSSQKVKEVVRGYRF